MIKINKFNIKMKEVMVETMPEKEASKFSYRCNSKNSNYFISRKTSKYKIF